MIKLTPFEFFFRGIPESILFIVVAYTFAKMHVNLRKCLISGIILAILGFVTRYLPVHYGVHTILNLFAFIILTYNINKIDLIKAITAGVCSVLLQLICELINIVIIQFVFRQDLNYILSVPKLKTLYGMPSLFIFGIIIIASYKLTVKGRITNGKAM